MFRISIYIYIRVPVNSNGEPIKLTMSSKLAVHKCLLCVFSVLVKYKVGSVAEKPI